MDRTPPSARMTTVPQYTVRLFAGLREMIGAREITIDVPDGATADGLKQRLGELHPHVEPMLPTIACAVNEEYVDGGHVLRAGDDVALIPPVSGGC